MPGRQSVQQSPAHAAEPLLRRALAINEKALAPEHPDTIKIRKILALLLQEKAASQTARPTNTAIVQSSDKSHLRRSKLKAKGVAEKVEAALPKTKLKSATTKVAAKVTRSPTAAKAASIKKKPNKARVVAKAKVKRPTGTKRGPSRGAKRR